jgi:NADPH:quinone reductase
MKAVVYTRHGPADVLRLVARKPEEPGPGEVRVRVAVSGVNPTDWKRRLGENDGAPAESETVPHHDGAGVVDAVGPGVSGLAVGDRVWTFMAEDHRRASGTAQEYTVLPVNRVALLPANAHFDLGACLGVPALTAHRALTVAEDSPRRLGPGALAGRTVLVSGGAGAVGHAAIQLARWAGATVVTTVSGESKAALARAAGAHHVFRYDRPGLPESIREVAPDGVDSVVEVAAGVNAELNAAVIRERGTVAVYGNERGGDRLALDYRTHLWLNARYQFLVLYTVGDEALLAGADDVNAALADEALPIGEAAGLPLHRHPLADTAKAHQAVEGGAVGKVLVDVATR